MSQIQMTAPSDGANVQEGLVAEWCKDGHSVQSRGYGGLNKGV